MAQTIKKKELINTELAHHYGGWIYCSSCRQTIGYLCYVTYRKYHMDYVCKCGNHGSLNLELEEEGEGIPSSDKLNLIKNRLCCPSDESPLVTILRNKLDRFSYQIVCKACNHEYREEGEE